MEHELPFVVMIFTLMAASGISPYESWKKMRKLTFLPNFKKEADEVVCLQSPEDFYAVGQFFEDFSEVTDDMVVAALAAAAKPVAHGYA